MRHEGGKGAVVCQRVAAVVPYRHKHPFNSAARDTFIMADISEYERSRELNIRRNNAKLSELGLANSPIGRTRKRKRPKAPRKGARVRGPVRVRVCVKVKLVFASMHTYPQTRPPTHTTHTHRPHARGSREQAKVGAQPGT